jgi:GT2 family glycosyltransferase
VDSFLDVVGDALRDVARHRPVRRDRKVRHEGVIVSAEEPAVALDGPPPYVPVVVLHWGNPDTTVRCLQSLGKACWPGRRTVLVIDNTGQLDAALLETAAPLEIEVHRAASNLGFSAGCTFGLSAAIARGADSVLLLNNDVVVDPGFLAPLLRAMEEAEDAGLLSPQIMAMEHPDRAWYRGGTFSLWSGIPVQGYRQRPEHASHPPREVDYATGCAMLVRPALIRRVGSFDPRFFAYCEDLDLSVRARRAGFRILFVPGSRVYHETIGEPDRVSLRIYYSTRNLIEVMRKHGAWYNWASFSANFLVRWVGFFALLAVVRGQPRHAVAVLRGMTDFARGRLGQSAWAADTRAATFSSAAQR